MGMHHGYLVAACAWPELRNALEALTGPLREVAGQTEAVQDTVRVDDSGDATYLLDGSTLLSADADLIVRVSEELGCRVVGMGAETVSGSVWFTAAMAGEAQRIYFDIGATLTRPFQHGQPFPIEQSIHWGDLDGAALHAALTAYGFSPDPLDRLWQSQVTFAPSFQRSEPVGTFGTAISQHVQQFEAANAEDWTNNLQVVTRDGGFDLVARRPKRSRLAKWFRRGSD